MPACAAHAGVDVMGTVDDIAVALSAAAVVLVPIWEGGGVRLKALEAMAAGRALVATPFGVTGTGAVDGVEALLADEPASLGQALGRLLAEPATAAAFAAAGRRRADAARWSDTLAPVVARYREWLGP